MNKREKEVLQAQLDTEKKVLKKLEAQYKKALNDIDDKIKLFEADITRLDSALQEDGLDEQAKAVLQSQRRAKVYQKQYQQALQGQISGTLDKLHGDQYATIQEYLNACYTDSYIGTMYDIHGQGIPLIIPIDQSAAVKAIQIDSKINKGLYTALGVNAAQLKKSIAAEVTRGIATSLSYADIARNISNATKAPLNRANTIVRTEGHRVQQASTLNAQRAAKKKGADVDKQWDATLDGKTRDTHRQLDGQIREVDEYYEVDGKKAMNPGDFGRPEEDCNCRCASLTRAKWALDDEELQTLKDRAKFFGLDKAKDFEDFKQKYLKLPENADKINLGKILQNPIKSSEEHYKQLLDDLAILNSDGDCAYNPVVSYTEVISEENIIKNLAGGDQTSGSCASVGLAYVGQKQGWNVLDFRGGKSEQFFSSTRNLHELSLAKGLKVLKAEGASSITVGNRLLKQVENGKEYFLSVGYHVSIVRKTEDGILQYLELQSEKNSGWTNFDGNPRYTLKDRFGCSSASDGSAYWDFMIDLSGSDFNTDDFKSLLGYINTAESEQRKGLNGTIK